MKIKKIGAALAAAAVSMAMLAGCGNSLEGKWHCVKLKGGGEVLDDEDCREEYGYGIGRYAELEFKGDGTGTFAVMAGTVMADFDWEKDGDGYELDFKSEDIGYDYADVELSDGQLIMEITAGGETGKLYFEAGESDEEVDPKVAKLTKTALKRANSNAKLTYTSVAVACADLMADGMASSISTGRFGPVAISSLDESDPVQKAIKTAMQDNGSDAGYVAWEVDSQYKPVWAQWAEEANDTLVGQYPDPETEPKTEHIIGTYFGDRY